jgi:hypothetical protein
MATNTNIDTSTQIVREAPEIEAYKLGLLQEAQGLYNEPLNLPAYEAAGLSGSTLQGIDLAKQGIGAYQPYLDAASAGITQGQNIAQQGADVASNVNVAPTFANAQGIMNQGVTAAGGIGEAADLAGNYLQANLGESQGVLGTAAGMAQNAINAGIPTQGAALGTVGQGVNAYNQMAGGAAAQGVGQALVGQGAQRADQMVTASMPAINQGQATIGRGVETAGRISDAGLGAQQTGQNYVAQGANLSGQMVGTGITAQERGLSAVEQGIAGLGRATAAYTPESAQAFMNPYQQQVTDKALQEMRRQATIAAQGTAAQAVRSGAFGGTREGVQRAEQERNLQDLMSQRVFQDMAANYNQAQTAGMTAFEQARQRELAAGQGTINAGTALGGLGTNAANIYSAAGQNLTSAGTATGALGTNAANILANQAGLEGTLGSQQGALGTAAANIYGQSGQNLVNAGQAAGALGVNEANIYGNMGQGLTNAGATQSNIGTAASNIYGNAANTTANIGSTLGNQAISNTQLGQSGTSNMGSLSASEAATLGNLGQGIGALGTQEANIDLSKANTMSNIGGNIANMGTAQGALGESVQRANINDVNLLTGIGSIEQTNAQNQIDAARNTALQEEMAPYQQLGFVSDVYKGAPSTQMTMTSSSAPQPSTFQTVAGTGLGLATTAAAASKAGIF